jgi:hypothetical protein
MAEETKKSTTTTKKRTTTSKPKVEEPKPQLSIEEQMAQMMAMMMAQQQQLMELMAKQQQEPVNTVVDEVIEKPKKTKRTRSENRITKQDLRRKYKGVDIYVANVSQGYVSYHGKNMTYEWKHNGDIEIVSIDDIINMPKSYLSTPWLCLDGYENDEEMIDEIVNVLKLGHVYEYIYTLQDMEENINEVEIEEVEKAIALSRNNGYDISMDLVILIDRKIRSGELTNYVFIGQLSELLGRKFL